MNNFRRYPIAFLICGVATICSTTAASAQGGGMRIQKDALQKANWHTAPREFQIIDDRPIIKDFREAPQKADNTIELPIGPAGSGAGALRTSDSMNLPKAGFGQASNMPARGLGPGHLLPGIGHSNLGNMMSPAKAASTGAPARRMVSAPVKSSGNGSTPIASYGGYGTGGGSSYGGNSSSSSASVRGTLLKK
jgi:hypothetical protein